MNVDPFRTGANALRYWEERQQVVSNNLANADTQGFKAERVFARLLGDTIATQAATDFKAGSISPTGNPLDFALEGDGFLVVSTAQGERLTRGGSFGIDSEGRLTDGAGNRVVGTDGDIYVRDGQVDVDASGTVRVDGVDVGRLRLVRAAPGTQLLHEDGVRFRAEGEVTDVRDVRVRQGYIEGSNVNALQSMVEMIEIQRSYAAVQSSLRTMDGVMDRVVNQLGRLT